jgi:simple sugar transport system substrate-binding protein
MVSHGLTGWGVGVRKLPINSMLMPIRQGQQPRIRLQQVKVIEDLIAKNVNAIIVVPNDATVLEPVLKSPG